MIIILTEILEVLEQGHTLSQNDLTKLLGGTEESMKAQIEFLETQGYIKRVTLPLCNGSLLVCGKLFKIK